MCKAWWQEGRRPQVAPRTGLSRKLAPGQQVLRSGTGPERTPPRQARPGDRTKPGPHLCPAGGLGELSPHSELQFPSPSCPPLGHQEDP